VPMRRWRKSPSDGTTSPTTCAPGTGDTISLCTVVYSCVQVMKCSQWHLAIQLQLARHAFVHTRTPSADPWLGEAVTHDPRTRRRRHAYASLVVPSAECGPRVIGHAQTINIKYEKNEIRLKVLTSIFILMLVTHVHTTDMQCMQTLSL
jgi:hypothetical protein